MMYAQEAVPMEADSIAKQTEDQIEKLVEESHKHGGLTQWMTRVLTRNPNRTRSTPIDETIYRDKINQAHGKTIRNLKIVTLDPAGYTVHDEEAEPTRWLEKAGNIMHIRTRKLAVRNFLRIRRNQVLDSTTIYESERLLRNQSFIRRARISVDTNYVSKDSVDLVVRVLDSWSTLPVLSVSGSAIRGQVREKNFLGLGHNFKNKVLYRSEDARAVYSGDYLIPNIYNTYISANFRYSQDLEDNYLKKISFDRTFYSNTTQWAAGASITELYHNDSLPDANMNWEKQTLNTVKQSYWAGYAMPIFKSLREKNRDVKLVFSAAFENDNHTERPGAAYDSIGYYTNERKHFFKIALSNNRYEKDRFLYRHNEIEYVPVGQVLSLTSGWRHKRNENHLYLGAGYRFGNYRFKGYLGADLEFGTYFEKSGRLNQGVASLRVNYFTDIKNIGRWRMRHFLTAQTVIGINRKDIVADRLYLFGEGGIQGYNKTVYGSKKAILTMQTQTYSPGSWLGFRANPYLSSSFGVLAEKGVSFIKSPLYSKLSLGVLLTNDYFVVERLQLSFSYFPHIPGDGSHILKFNSMRNDDLRIKDFQSERPKEVDYTYPRENLYP